jgi:TetR/AcrR family transcriptional repressor of nem operon
VTADRSFRPATATARDKLLEAAVKLVRTHGFAATSVDQLCAEAAVSKGAFFHHFASKEELGVATADYWSQCTSDFFAAAPYHLHQRAIDRVLGYIDFRIVLIEGAPEQFSCVAGTMVQEAFRSSEAIRQACRASIMGNASTLVADIAEAMVDARITDTTPESLARHVQTVIQGAFVLAKSQGNDVAAHPAREQLGHLRRYFELLLAAATKEHIQ